MDPIIRMPPDRLARYFAARGEAHVVLRKSDLLRLTPDLQLAVIEIATKLDYPGAATADLVHLGEGCPLIILPWLRLRALPIEDHETLQEVVEAYKDDRRARGVPTVRKPCDCREGTACSICGNSRVVSVLQEFDPQEQAAAVDSMPAAWRWWL